MFFFKVSLILDLWQFVSSSCMYLRKISGLSHLLFHRNRASLILSVLHLPIYPTFFQLSLLKSNHFSSKSIKRRNIKELWLGKQMADGVSMNSTEIALWHTRQEIKKFMNLLKMKPCQTEQIFFHSISYSICLCWFTWK